MHLPKENWTLEQTERFDDILDVRSPDEYALDHIPGALNFPVLENEERAHVGKLYKQVSRFEAKKQGAALVAGHIADYLQQFFSSKPELWNPLVYCWRGGTRSAAMVQVFNSIGWRAQQLPGGYKAYRRKVIETIATLSGKFSFLVLCGRTGVGKTRLLEVMRERNNQVLDLESIANHRGSVLGEPVTGGQPSQKWFESQVCDTLRQFDSRQSVYVESESRKVGRLQVPAPLFEAMHRGCCIRIEADLQQRVDFLLSEYQHFLDTPELFERALRRLVPHVGKQKVAQWLAQYAKSDMKNLVEDLLVNYYDPFYLRSIVKHFPVYQNSGNVVEIDSADSQAFAKAAVELEHKNWLDTVEHKGR